jgi:hypothetical protein
VASIEHLVHVFTPASASHVERGFVELDEDALAVNLIGWHPVRLAAREAAICGRSFGSPDSSGASTRVKPNKAFTSRKRSGARLRYGCSKPVGVPTFLLMKCG